MSELHRLYQGARCEGAIKSAPEDFVVEEITPSGAAIEAGRHYVPAELGLEEMPGKFCIFVMQKRNWNTSQALRAISKMLGKGLRSMGFAGTKDRLAVSTQLCSTFGIVPAQLEGFHIKDISINGAWTGESQVGLGDLMGNRFTVTVRNASMQDGIPKALEALNGRFPNYFGEQRFGFRGNNVKIGVSLLKGDFEGAVMSFLTDTDNEKQADAIEARKRLLETRDFKAALRYFPRYLKYERAVLEHLSRFPANYANAFRRLPRPLALMFVHAVEDSIFNAELGRRVEEGSVQLEEGDLACLPNSYGFPDISTTAIFSQEMGGAFLVGNVVGYDTERPTELEKGLLEELGLGTESFKMAGMRELNCRGAFRAMLAPYRGMSAVQGQDSAELKFELPAGSYATVLLSELVDAESQK